MCGQVAAVQVSPVLASSAPAGLKPAPVGVLDPNQAAAGMQRLHLEGDVDNELTAYFGVSTAAAAVDKEAPRHCCSHTLLC